MRIQVFRRWAGAGMGGALLLSLMATGPASAAFPATEPAPSCVTVYESWRYTQAENACAETMTVKVVYQDGAEGPCYAVPPGDVTTIGEGYLGRHGHVHHVAVCPAPAAAAGVTSVE
ncbi:alpha-amylase [Streptomyces sp. NPDC052015]|uniref:alpha-amylase n=1 Tax=Streptomyces sp. NPDC052015 TaxID=3154755 RepID=UPI0034361374